MTLSAFYEGEVAHHRVGPTPHSFTYRLSLAYLDLDELPTLFSGRWLWSARRFNLAWFRRADYLGPAERPLDEAVRDLVEERLGRRPRGPVRLLTQLRTLGYVFNPVSFYYCHDEDGALAAVVAEITNTPWGERHAYVLDAADCVREDALAWRFDKAFHVSPFFDMQQVYEWTFDRPGERLSVRMRNFEQGEVVFLAGLECTRREMTAGAFARALLLHPLQTFRVHAAIYWQAARLYLKKTPFFVHPDKRPPAEDALTS